jgi:hypothetical protein
MQWFIRLFDSSLPRRTLLVRGVLLGLLAAAYAYRVWLVASFNPIDSLWSDPGRHWNLGIRPLDTQPLAAIDPIGYHVYTGILAKLTAGSAVLVAYWTSLLSLSGPWLWYRFLRELLPNRDWALAGWVALAALPSWSAIYSFFMQETLMLPLLGAALWATWRCRRKGDTASFVIAVGVWILAGLTRGICIPLAAVAMSWLWFLQGNKASKAAYSMILLLAVLGPLAGRSWYLVRQISPHGVASMNHLYSRAGTLSFSIDLTRSEGAESWNYEFISPALMNPPFEPFSNWRSHREGNAHFTIDLDAGRRDWASASDSLPPWTLSRAVWLTGDNLISLFFAPSWPEMHMPGSTGALNRWIRWVWVPLSIFCLVWAVARRSSERERLLPALLLTWFLFQGVLPISVNEGRYRKPFEGLLIAYCLLLASAARQKYEERSVVLSPVLGASLEGK